MPCVAFHLLIYSCRRAVGFGWCIFCVLPSANDSAFAIPHILDATQCTRGQADRTTYVRHSSCFMPSKDSVSLDIEFYTWFGWIVVFVIWKINMFIILIIQWKNREPSSFRPFVHWSCMLKYFWSRLPGISQPLYREHDDKPSKIDWILGDQDLHNQSIASINAMAREQALGCWKWWDQGTRIPKLPSKSGWWIRVSRC